MQDELAIHHLIARIAQLADGGTVEDYVACFTEDAQWDMPGAPRRGRADIRAGSEARRATNETGPDSFTRHLVSTIAVTIDGDRATARSYWQFYVNTATAPELRLMGQYDDELIRADGGGWLLDHRGITFG